MKKSILFLLSAAILFFSACVSAPVRQTPIPEFQAASPAERKAVEVQYVKIGIILNTTYFTVSSVKDFTVTDASGKTLHLSKGNVKFSYYSDGRLGFGTFALDLPVTIDNTGDFIYVNKKAYRGYAAVYKDGGSVNVINILPIEDYIRGVVPKEADLGWHEEALKAQAVISRTYTLANLGNHKDKGFDMCSETHCQVYGGAEAETAQTNAAVDATRCQVITFNGKFANALFHANCGGHTEDPKYVWGTANTPEYLKGVKCDYCKDAPYSSWKQDLDESYIRKKLSAAGFDTGAIQSIKVNGVTPAGSAKEVVITGTKKSVTMNAYKFRLAVDAWKIKSVTFDSIKKDGDKFVFKGRGWGHKVGLCQWGAEGMAKAGKNYAQILEYYYPGTKLEKIK